MIYRNVSPQYQLDSKLHISRLCKDNRTLEEVRTLISKPTKYLRLNTYFPLFYFSYTYDLPLSTGIESPQSLQSYSGPKYLSLPFEYFPSR